MTTVPARADDFRGRVSSWSDLAELIEHFSFFSAHDWLFRGVTDDGYLLVPKIGRPELRAVKADPSTKVRARVPYREEDERAVFNMFQQQARAHVNPAPHTRLEWLAVAQHFGLPTRLLDWTESILVAAWFAVERGGAKANKANAAVWVTRGATSIDPSSEMDPFGNGAPTVYRPPHVSPRISAQASVLMLCPTPTLPVSLSFVRKIVVSRDAEFLIKKRLNTCGVNRRALFPDLAGLAGHLTWLHKQDYLAGYRDRGVASIPPTADDAPEEPA